jgi:hypothetical protein
VYGAAHLVEISIIAIGDQASVVKSSLHRRLDRLLTRVLLKPTIVRAHVADLHSSHPLLDLISPFSISVVIPDGRLAAFFRHIAALTIPIFVPRSAPATPSSTPTSTRPTAPTTSPFFMTALLVCWLGTVLGPFVSLALFTNCSVGCRLDYMLICKGIRITTSGLALPCPFLPAGFHR